MFSRKKSTLNVFHFRRLVLLIKGMCKMYKEKATFFGCQNRCRNVSIVFKLPKLRLLMMLLSFRKGRHHLLGVLDNVLTNLNKTSGDSPL